MDKKKIIDQFERKRVRLDRLKTMSEFITWVTVTVDLALNQVPNMSATIERLNQLSELPKGLHKTPLTEPKQRYNASVLDGRKNIAGKLIDEIIEHIDKNVSDEFVKKSFWDKFDVKVLLGLLVPTFTLWMITLFAYFNTVNTGYSIEYTKGKNAGKDESQIQINSLTKDIGLLQDSIGHLTDQIKKQTFY